MEENIFTEFSTAFWPQLICDLRETDRGVAVANGEKSQ
jgi:hypothetical protein